MPNTTVLLVIVQRSSPDIPNSIVLLAVVKESQPGYSYFDLSIGGRLRVSAQVFLTQLFLTALIGGRVRNQARIFLMRLFYRLSFPRYPSR
eukprot:8535207-Pyramimonas_sp.AAC.1